MDSKLDKIWDNGWDYGYDDLGNDNPYASETPEHKVWNSGYENGKAQRELDEAK